MHLGISHSKDQTVLYVSFWGWLGSSLKVAGLLARNYTKCSKSILVP